MLHARPLRLLPAIVLLALTGCKMQTGSYQIDASKSFTLQRTTQFFWSSNVERWLTISRMPDCQRKHKMQNDTSKRFSSVQLRKLDEMTYQVDDDGTLYLANLENCTFTALPDKAAKEGELVGKFSESRSDKIPFDAARQQPARN